ncbi:MAG: multidrug efflux SMR transporter [Leptolyngbya sp.]|nr:multidrug efflux SMR transporter [Candidatus Melainabacteria bacterium]
MSWLILFLAGLFEIVWAVGLKVSSQSPSPWLYSVTVVAIIASMMLLALAMKEIPLGTAYAIWTGIGAIGSFIIGLIYFSEPISFARLASALFIVIGLVGLKLTSH